MFFNSTSEALYIVDFLRDDSPPFDLSAIGEDKELCTVWIRMIAKEIIACVDLKNKKDSGIII